MGMLVAVNISKYPDRPFIGRVVEGHKHEVVLEWLVGSYSGTWKEWKGREGDFHRHSVCRRHDIKLTVGKRLQPSKVKVLKSLYG